MNKQVEQYITNNYYELLKISKKITKGNPLYEDLLNDVICQLYSKECIVLHNYTPNVIKYYIVAIMRINWNSKTSPFYYSHRRYIANSNDIYDIPEIIDDEYDYDKDVVIEMVETEFAELEWFKKGIFELYLILGSVNKVSAQTKIAKSNITRYIRESKERIKNNVEQK